VPGDPLDPGPGPDAGRHQPVLLDGKPILHYMGCSTFSNHTVLPEIALAKVRPDAPFDKICYIGCGVTTGIGAVINTAKVEIGSNARRVRSRRHRPQRHPGRGWPAPNMIVGVDLNRQEGMGPKFGMTHFVNPSRRWMATWCPSRGADRGGADYTFECVGNVR
jgi:S-(hydroxymethyl)glutathione dehydrogenase/alcohol dehydrogenase